MLPERTECDTPTNNYISDTSHTEKQVCGGVPERNLQTNSTYHLNPLAYTAVRETAGLARSVNTQPAVRRSEPSISFAFNSSFLSVDGMTCLTPFES